MPFLVLIGLIVAALVVCAIYSCVRFGWAATRRAVRSMSSRIFIVLAAFAALLFSAVYCYDYLAVLVKGAMTTGAAEEFSETVKLFFGTTSVFASLKALLVSCLMLGLLSCVTFGLSGLATFSYSVQESNQKVDCGVEENTVCCKKFGRVKPFLAFAKYIS